MLGLKQVKLPYPRKEVNRFGIKTCPKTIILGLKYVTVSLPGKECYFFISTVHFPYHRNKVLKLKQNLKNNNFGLEQVNDIFWEIWY